MLLQEATAVAHPLSGSIAELVWLVPVLPLLGFVINGWLSIASASHVGPKDPSADGHDHVCIPLLDAKRLLLERYALALVPRSVHVERRESRMHALH